MDGLLWLAPDCHVRSPGVFVTVRGRQIAPADPRLITLPGHLSVCPPPPSQWLCSAMLGRVYGHGLWLILDGCSCGCSGFGGRKRDARKSGSTSSSPSTPASFPLRHFIFSQSARHHPCHSEKVRTYI